MLTEALFLRFLFKHIEEEHFRENLPNFRDETINRACVNTTQREFRYFPRGASLSQ